MGIITSDERWRAVRKSFYADFWPNCIVDNVTTNEEAKQKLLAEQKRLLKQAKRNKKAKKPLPVIQENSTGLECPVCFAQNANYVNVKCGHLTCCTDCMNAIRNHGKCPKCRAGLTQIIKIYV